MAAFNNWPQQKIDLLFHDFSALAIIFLFCHCFASEALFWLYQMRLELKVYSLPAKIFFSLHWRYTLVINSGFPVRVTLSKEETQRAGVTTGWQTSEQCPKTCCRKKTLFPTSGAAKMRISHEAPPDLVGLRRAERLGGESLQHSSLSRAVTDSTEAALLLSGFWEGPAVLRLSGHLIHTARHTRSLFMEVKSLCSNPWHRQVANTSWTDFPGCCLTSNQS